MVVWHTGPGDKKGPITSMAQYSGVIPMCIQPVSDPALAYIDNYPREALPYDVDASGFHIAKVGGF